MEPVASGSGSASKGKAVRASTSTKNRARSPSPFRSSNDTTLEEFMPEFWQHTLDNAEASEDDFKHQALPLARIKKVAKTDPDVQLISSEVTILFEKACQSFIQELTARAHIASLQSKRRTLARTDVAAALTKSDLFDFLIDIVPREERAAASSSNSNSNPSASTSHSKNGSTNGGAGKRPGRSRKSSQKARQQVIATPAAAEEEGDQNGQAGEGSYEMGYQAPTGQEELSFEGLEEFEQAVQQEEGGGAGERSIAQPPTQTQAQYQQVYQNHYTQTSHSQPEQQQAQYEQEEGEGGETNELPPGDGAFEGWDGLEKAPIDPNQFDSNPTSSNGAIQSWNGQFDYGAQQVTSSGQQIVIEGHEDTGDARGG